MAIAEKESSKREVIDQMLEKARTLAYENDQVAKGLRDSLIGAPPKKEGQGRPSRTGWLDEITDTLEIVIDLLDDTNHLLRDITKEVETQRPQALLQSQGAMR